MRKNEDGTFSLGGYTIRMEDAYGNPVTMRGEPTLTLREADDPPYFFSVDEHGTHYLGEGDEGKAQCLAAMGTIPRTPTREMTEEEGLAWVTQAMRDMRMEFGYDHDGELFVSKIQPTPEPDPNRTIVPLPKPPLGINCRCTMEITEAEEPTDGQHHHWHPSAGVYVAGFDPVAKTWNGIPLQELPTTLVPAPPSCGLGNHYKATPLCQVCGANVNHEIAQQRAHEIAQQRAQEYFTQDPGIPTITTRHHQDEFREMLPGRDMAKPAEFPFRTLLPPGRDVRETAPAVKPCRHPVTKSVSVQLFTSTAVDVVCADCGEVLG